MAVIHGIIAIIFTGMVFGVVFIAWLAGHARPANSRNMCGGIE
jgi:hypothetical protein